jgi:hypothetical protein
MMPLLLLRLLHRHQASMGDDNDHATASGGKKGDVQELQQAVLQVKLHLRHPDPPLPLQQQQQPLIGLRR